MNAIVLISFCKSYFISRPSSRRRPSLRPETLTQLTSGAGNIIGPLTFREEDAPEYIPAKIVMAVTTASAAVLTGMLMLYYRWENKRRGRLHAGEVHTENSEFFDLTDRENHEFRYVF